MNWLLEKSVFFLYCFFFTLKQNQTNPPYKPCLAKHKQKLTLIFLSAPFSIANTGIIASSSFSLSFSYFHILLSLTHSVYPCTFTAPSLTPTFSPLFHLTKIHMHVNIIVPSIIWWIVTDLHWGMDACNLWWCKILIPFLSNVPKVSNHW